jgi:Predicted membrane-associated HD superfamily hydrolase
MLLRRCAERVAQPAARAVRGIFREPVEQHVVWSYRCASFNHQPDQRIYSCLSHAAGATRGRLIRAGFFVGLAIWLLSLTFGLIGPINWFYPTANDWGMVGVQSALAVGNGIVTAMIVGGALPMLENLFGITTDISWLEASDLNHPLLRRMTIEAPGTYHHSLVVANLAEAAAEAVGANATLCRVCSIFMTSANW